MQSWSPLPVLVAVAVAVGCGQTASSHAGDSGTGAASTAPSSADYFYCVVQPQIIMGGLTQKPCGGSGGQSCHYSDSVPAMALTPLPSAITCSGSGTSAAPSDPAQVATDTAAATDFSTVALQMSADYTQAPFYLFPTGSNGHVVVFAPTDTAVVDIIKTWASAQ